MLFISARAGLWRDALESYLKADQRWEFHFIGRELKKLCDFPHRAASVTLLLEADLYGKELASTLVRLRNDHPALTCIVIADTHAQYQAALTAGVGPVVMKSMLHNQLDDIFIFQKGREGNASD